MIALRSARSSAARAFSTSAARQTHVAVLGASGGIGQPLSLLLKNNPLVTKLSLYDLFMTPGVAADLSHINTASEVKGYTPENDGLKHALTGAEIVVVPAGVPRKPGMTRDDLFNTNAGIVASLATAFAQYCPNAHLLVISNPVNSTVPICAEILKKAGVYNPKRLFGVTTLDVVRASRFVSEVKKTDPQGKVTVIGGHSGATIVPLLSQIQGCSFSDEERAALTQRIQFGGDEVVKAKDGKGSATLSMAMAGARFTGSLLQAIHGAKNVVEPTFVESPVLKDQGVEFFATNVELSPEGVGKIHPIGPISEYEKELLSKCIPDLKNNIQKGVEFAKAFTPK